MSSLVKNLIKFDKNQEEYIFHPRNILFQKGKKMQSSQSAQNIFNFKENQFNSIFDSSLDKEAQKLEPSENTFYNKKLVPPIYFYRKVQNPYKYNISSIPEYLIKTNEEKNFMDKLESYMKDENEKKKFNELIQKKERETKIKDRYKPEVLDVQTILKYRPSLYLNSLKFNKRTNHDINEITHKKTVNINSINNVKEEIKKEEINKKNYEIIKEDNKQISDEDQIKYKYKISDIYNKRNEKVITDKSAEKYLFKSQNRINTFYTSNQSQSDWIPNRDFGTKMNSFSSVSYNILSPMYKGFNKFITASELNKNNLYNQSPAFHKVKSISEFIDLTRVSSRNNLDVYNKDKTKKYPNFKFKGSIATDQLNAYHINRDLIPNPT